MRIAAGVLLGASMIALTGCGDGVDEQFSEAAGYEIEGCEKVGDELVDGSTVYKCRDGFAGLIDSSDQAYITGRGGGTGGSQGPSVVNADDVEQEISEYITSQGGTFGSITCPSDELLIDDGDTMTCEGSGPEGGSVPITATLANDQVEITSE